jgi:hypothetical protein
MDGAVRTGPATTHRRRSVERHSSRASTPHDGCVGVEKLRSSLQAERQLSLYIPFYSAALFDNSGAGSTRVSANSAATAALPAVREPKAQAVDAFTPDDNSCLHPPPNNCTRLQESG